MDKSELEALLARIDVWLLIFGIVVVIGVAGESFFGIRHWWNSRKLKDLQDKENAAQSAEISRLNNATAEALRQAAEANRIAEEEKLARVKIEQRLAPRQISGTEYLGLVATLKPHAGAVVEIDKIMGDKEAEPFGDEIIRSLTESKWVLHISASGMRMPPVYGLQCRVNDSSPAGKAFVAAFKSLPTAHIVSDHSLKVVASIVVGLKPPP